MPATFSEERIQKVIDFHGHSCPGLSIGIRAAELARLRWPDARDSELVAVVETDMCGVDAIQHLLGCTYGKGNLIHRDYGKMAFSFYNRPAKEGFRAVLRHEARGNTARMGELMGKVLKGVATSEEKKESEELRSNQQAYLMCEALQNLFCVQELETPPPTPACILASLCCDKCGEMAMESRTRRFAGQTLCIPCFETMEQKR